MMTATRPALAALDIAIKFVAQSRIRFDADEIWSRLSDTGVKVARDPRLMGNALAEARKRGICRPTSIHVPSRRRICHGRPIRTWESLVYDPRPADG